MKNNLCHEMLHELFLRGKIRISIQEWYKVNRSELFFYAFKKSDMSN
jgi:hypothetical protein